MKSRLFVFVLITGLVLGLFSNAGTLSVRADNDFSDTAFVGDSRVKVLSTGGVYEYALLPDADVYASWSDLVTDKPSFDDAWMAGYQKRPKAVFWYGIYDVQTGDMEDQDDFVRHIEDLIVTFREENTDAQVYIVSVLPASASHSGYYEGQNENIRRYNEALSAFCANNGHIFVDITDLYSESDLLDGDYLNFKKEWYSDKFLPRMDVVLHGEPEPETEPATEPPVVTEPDVTETPSETETETETPAPTQEITTSAPQTTAPQTTPAPPTTETPGKNGEKKSLAAWEIALIVIGVLLLLAALAIGFLAYRNYQARKRRRNRRRHHTNK